MPGTQRDRLRGDGRRLATGANHLAGRLPRRRPNERDGGPVGRLGLPYGGHQRASCAAPSGLLDCGGCRAGVRRERGRSATRRAARCRYPTPSGRCRLCQLSAAGHRRRAVATGDGRCLPAARRQLAGHSVHAGIAAAGLHGAAAAGRRRVSERLRLSGLLSRLGPGLGWRPVVLGLCPGDRRGAKIPFLPWVQPRLSRTVSATDLRTASPMAPPPGMAASAACTADTEGRRCFHHARPRAGAVRFGKYSCRKENHEQLEAAVAGPDPAHALSGGPPAFPRRGCPDQVRAKRFCAVGYGMPRRVRCLRCSPASPKARRSRLAAVVTRPARRSNGGSCLRRAARDGPCRWCPRPGSPRPCRSAGSRRRWR